MAGDAPGNANSSAPPRASDIHQNTQPNSSDSAVSGGSTVSQAAQASAKFSEDAISTPARPAPQADNSVNTRSESAPTVTDNSAATSSGGSSRPVAAPGIPGLDTHFGGGNEIPEDHQELLSQEAIPGFVGGGASAVMQARDAIIQGQLAEGTSSVTNMSITVGDNTLQGPVGFNSQGQYLVDPNAGKYRILPADDQSPNGYLQPYGRSDTQPMAIDSIKALSGDVGFGNWGWDGPPPAFQPRQDVPTSDTAAGLPIPSSRDNPTPTLEGGISESNFISSPQNGLGLPGGFIFKPDGTLMAPDGTAIGGVPNDQVGSFQQVLGIMTNGSPQSAAFLGALSNLGRSDGPTMQDGGANDVKSLLQQLSTSPDPRLQGLGQIVQQALMQGLQSGMLSGTTGDAAAGKPTAGSGGGSGIGIPMGTGDIGIGIGGDKTATGKSVESQLDMRLAAQLSNPVARQALADVISQLQLGRSPFDPNSNEGKQLRSTLEMLGGKDGLQNLKILLLDTKGNTAPRLDTIFALDQQMKLRELIALIIKGTQGAAPRDAAADRPPARSDASAKSPIATPAERIIDILRLQPISKVPGEAETKAMLVALGKSIRDLNEARREANQSPATMRNLISRSLTVPAVSHALSVKPGHDSAQTIRSLVATMKRTPKSVKVDEAMRNIIRREGETPAGEGRTARDAKETEPKKNLGDEDEQAAAKRRKRQEPDTAANEEADAAVLLTKKKPKPEKEKDEEETVAEKDKKEPDRRQRYIVKQGDTLESIAEKQLRDKRLAGLIYEINKKTIPTEIVNSKTIPRLRPRMVLWLPTPAESADYRSDLASGLTHAAVAEHSGVPDVAKAEDELSARFGGNWDGGKGASGDAAVAAPVAVGSGDAAVAAPGTGSLEDMQDAAAAFYSERRKRVEELLGPLKSVEEDPRNKHIVRLGDTLKSIAMNHPALQDVKLWKLLAHVNNLPEAVDEKGSPIAKLKRGQVLRLPSPEQVTAYRASHMRAPDNALGIFTATCATCGRATFVSAQVCPKCGATMPGAHSAAAPVQPTASVDTGGTRSPRTRSAAADPDVADTVVSPPEPQTKPAAARAVVTVERVLDAGETARITRFGSPTDLSTGFRVSLEVKRGGTWMPAIVYEFLEKGIQRHEYNKDGSRKSMQVDLPIAAAIQMAYNEIDSNWQKQV